MIERVRQWNTQCSLIIYGQSKSFIVIVTVNVPQLDNHTLWSATLWVTRLMLTQLSPLVGITQLYIHCNSLYILVDRFFWTQHCQHFQSHTVVHLLHLTIYPSWLIFLETMLSTFSRSHRSISTIYSIVIVKSLKGCRSRPLYQHIITSTQIQVTE